PVVRSRGSESRLRGRTQGGEQSDTDQRRSRRVGPQTGSYRGLAGVAGAAGAGGAKVNSPRGGRSAPAWALKYAFSLNPKMRPRKLVGNFSSAVLYSCARSL